MEYTKDLILNVNYGQAGKTKKGGLGILEKVVEKIAKHKAISTIVSITLMLMFLDIMLVSSFVEILSSI